MKEFFYLYIAHSEEEILARMDIVYEKPLPNRCRKSRNYPE